MIQTLTLPSVTAVRISAVTRSRWSEAAELRERNNQGGRGFNSNRISGFSTPDERLIKPERFLLIVGLRMDGEEAWICLDLQLALEEFV